MKISDLMRMALKNLTSRKLRTFLTILGVIIGSISIIVMVSFGHGITATNAQFIESMGNIKEIKVYKKEDPNKTVSNQTDEFGYGGYYGEGNLTTNHVAELKEYSHVDTVIGTLNLSGFQIIANNRYESWNNITGIDLSHLDILGLELEEGTIPTNPGNGIIFGPEASKDFYSTRGQEGRREENINFNTSKLELRPYSYEMDEFGNEIVSNQDVKRIKYIGTLKETSNWEYSYAVYADINFVRDILIEQDKKQKSDNSGGMMGGNQEKKKDPKTKLDSIRVIVDEPENVDSVKQMLETDGYSVSALTDMLDSLEEQTRIFKWIFGGIGAISLLVAAIGISNTMVMSIQERTREIGVMKVIGASLQDIKRLFLVEASMIGLLGGIVGVIISYIISFVINHFATQFLAGQTGDPTDTIKISIIPVFLAVMALVFSALIGLVSGYFPARRAMKLSALDAIRAD